MAPAQASSGTTLGRHVVCRIEPIQLGVVNGDSSAAAAASPEPPLASIDPAPDRVPTFNRIPPPLPPPFDVEPPLARTCRRSVPNLP